jgi:hypothetical protein
MERGGYKKIPLVGFQDIYKTDLQNSFRPNRAKIRGVSSLCSNTNSRGDLGTFKQKPVENPGCETNLDQGKNAFADVAGILRFWQLIE